jgi:HPt (histidine-containing phosphotransfer) domain-containing protein
VAEPEGAIDPEAIGTLMELVGDDHAFLGELIDTFLADTPAQLEAMREAAAAGDAAALVRPAHTLKTNSRNLGAHQLAELCLRLETEARQGAVGDAVERVAAAEAAFAAARAELERIRDA